jgi:cytoskeletal protein CcmA (bactofilin family)
MGEDAKRTLVAEGTELKGTLSSDCPVEVRGSVEGDVAAPLLAVHGTGSVRGTVKVGELDSEGRLSGEFDADTVRLAGAVQERTVIRARSLEVKLSSADGKMQVVFSECGPPRETLSAPPPKSP